ncbi:hypothetical protein TNIN_337181 [Trichonephila inaurata madagascariensis]|uniref:DNA polymerase delta subunit 3 n=1 Tax=Trichonephila inaurata madagascariensis TaxID=2747483 RepID=A0A8X6XU86_9ARAC|nr:hypothetical protein TNIN_337181 [Trichonephila inaurata madagascariensis]
MSQNECFERLEELIMDEDRTVTYKLLSRECKIHVNLAKQYLHEFAEKQKSEIKNLHSTYFVAGYGNGGKGNVFKLFVVSQNNLEDIKKSLSEVTSCHIFSVGRGKRDEWGLFRDDQHYNATLENNHNYSAIKNSNVEIKSPVLSKATNEQSNGLKKEAKAPLVPKVSASFFKNVSKNSVEQKNNQDHHTENNVDNNADSTEVEKSKTCSPAKKQKSEKSQKPNTLASMWQKNEDKMKDVKDINSKSDAKPKAKETKPVAKNSIMNMFSKQAEKKAENNFKKSSVSHSTDTSDKTESTKEKLVSDTKPVEVPKPKEEAHSSKPTSQKRKSSPRQSKTSSKLKNENKSDDESGPKKKKHRRICTFDDSDSESESEEAKDRAQRKLWEPEDPLEAVSSIQPATPASDDSEELIPPTPPVVSKGKKKVWKTIQKTFEEDGFLVTKQEKELVSEDDEDPVPQNIKASKPNPFTYRKQASLTSFFKQK